MQASGLNETYKWQIFDADEDHIYLISKDYIQVKDCPAKGSYAVTETSTYYGPLTNVINGYSGATNVDTSLRSLNNAFFNFNSTKTSTNANAKAMAYLLDKDIWSYIFGYKINYVKQNIPSVGFPLRTLSKIQAKLEQKKTIE